MVGLGFSTKIHISLVRDFSFNESIVVELKFGRKHFFLQFYIEVLHLTIIHLIFKPSYQILEIYMLKLKLKTFLQYFFLETLMLTFNSGGLMGIQLLKARKLKILVHL